MKHQKYVNVNMLSLYNLGIKHNIQITLVEGAIFSWFCTFSGSQKVKRMIIDDELYLWGSYQKIMGDMPYMGISSKRTIARKADNLVAIGVFKKKVIKSDGNKTFFNITGIAYDYVINGDFVLKEDEVCTPESIGVCTDESIGYVPESTKVCTDESIGVCTQEYNNSILINSTLNSNKKNNKKKEFLELLDRLSKVVKRKTKIKFTEKALKLYSALSDTSSVEKLYIEHAEREGQYAQTIANFLLDYEGVVTDTKTANRRDFSSEDRGSIAWKIKNAQNSDLTQEENIIDCVIDDGEIP